MLSLRYLFLSTFVLQTINSVMLKSPLSSFRASVRFSTALQKSSIRGNSAIQRASKLATAAFSTASASNNTIEKFTPVQHPHFDLLRTTRISEYNLDAALYVHKSSGAQVLSVCAPDDNKVFGITFRTPPADSTGVAHILEHSVLCGSRKYKSKEPFVDLIKGSVNTFLNAFTYPDRTCYPVASQNTKDFYNLVDVYMDAVLHPRAMLDPQVLQQEGWHYELEREADPLTYKGVVFNEMKGVYSSSDSLLAKAAQEALFPDNAYNVDSGGDPRHIPSLSFEAFCAFHATTYHPSNSRIYFYGDDDPLRRLELLHDYLADYRRLPEEQVRSTGVAPQSALPHLHEAPPLVVRYPVEAESLGESGHVITVNWLLQGGQGQGLSGKDELALAVLDHLLLGTSSAVLKKALTESKLGESVAGGGLSDELVQPTFSVGMKGVAAADTGKVQQLVLDTLRQVASTGFDEEAIRASVNSIEFDLREFNTGGYPKGLSVMLGVMSHWIYDRDPFEALRFEEALGELKAELQAGRPVFQDLVRRHLLDNGHRVSVLMVPDAEVAGEELERERLQLQLAKDDMSPQQLQQIIRATAQLRAAQEAEDSAEAKATIPRLALHDLAAAPREIPISVQRGALPLRHDLLLHDLPSSGILYVDVGLDFSAVPLADAPLLPLFARMLTEAGTSSRSQVVLSRYIGAETGGVHASWSSGLRSSARPGTVKEDNTDVTLYLMLRGKCTGHKTPVLFEILSDILLGAQLDNKQRAIEMLLEVKARRVNSVVGNGHSYGMARLAGKKSFLGHLGEHTGGLSYLRAVDSLLAQMESDWPAVQRRLEGIRRALLAGASSSSASAASESDQARPARVVVNLTGDEQLLLAARAPVAAFLQSVAAAGKQSGPEEGGGAGRMVREWVATSQAEQLQASGGGEGISVPSQVNYVVKGGPLFQPGEPVSAAHAVVARFLGTGYLWDTVRVMGGAYGGFGSFSPHSGKFVFASYRDPNVADTLRVYDRAGEALQQAVREEEEGERSAAPASASVTPEGEQDQDQDQDDQGAASYTIPRLSHEDVTQSVIGFMGDLDSPLSTDQKGYSSLSDYLAGETAADRAQWRQQALGTSAADFREFADRLIALSAPGAADVVVVGSQMALEKANAVLPAHQQLKVAPAFSKQ